MKWLSFTRGLTVTVVHRPPGDYPAGKQGDVLIIEFPVMGIGGFFGRE